MIGGGGLIPAALVVALPIGAIVMRRHWRSATGWMRSFLFLLLGGGILFARPAMRLIWFAVLDALSDVAAAALLIGWRPLAIALVVAVPIAALTIRRHPLLTFRDVLRGDEIAGAQSRRNR